MPLTYDRFLELCFDSDELLAKFDATNGTKLARGASQSDLVKFQVFAFTLYLELAEESKTVWH